jgi:hypothetical protein
MGSPSPIEEKNPMIDNHDLLKCPLCEGHGEVRRGRVLEFVRDGMHLNRREDSILVEAEANQDPTELQEVGASNRTQRDLQKDVHSWNPQLSIWRRSPKE